MLLPLWLVLEKEFVFSLELDCRVKMKVGLPGKKSEKSNCFSLYQSKFDGKPLKPPQNYGFSDEYKAIRFAKFYAFIGVAR